jgi:hypothetical protein
MKKLAFTALAAAAALASTPAFAQASGTVDVTGTVASKCATVGTIAGTISLGELAKANGTVENTFGNNTGGLTRQFTVRCTGANPILSVNDSPLVNGAVTTPATGYTNTVHYTATLSAAAAGTGGATASAADTSNVSGATTAALNGRLSAANNNVSLVISNGNTTDAAAVLEAGNYSGSVAVLVSPAA